MLQSTGPGSPFRHNAQAAFVSTHVMTNLELLIGPFELSEESDDPLTANSKIVGCRNYVAGSNDDDVFLQGYCAGAVQALVEFAAGACAPKGATNMQGVQIVVKYIDARPARLQESFNKLAAEALRQAWPCSN